MYAGIPGRRLTHESRRCPSPAYGSPPLRAATTRSGAARTAQWRCAVASTSRARFPTPRARTNSSTATGGCSTWAKPSRCAAGSPITSPIPPPSPPRTAQMVGLADHVEWIQVANEVEAILLEYALIKRHRPRFNIRLADDKSYPSLAVTVADEWPRAAVVRGRRRPGVRYFGPYAHVGAIRDTLDLLLRTFQVRTCSDRKLERHTKLGKPCLLYHIERCSGPCIGAVEPRPLRRHGGRPHGLPRRRHRRRRAPPRGRDEPGRRRPRLRARRPSARPPAHPAHGARAPAGRDRPARGPRRGRDRRGRPRGGGVRLPRAPGPHRGAARLRGGQGGGPDERRSWWGGCSRSSTATPSPSTPPRVGGPGAGWRQFGVDLGRRRPRAVGDRGGGGARGAAPGARARAARPARGLRGLPRPTAAAAPWPCACPSGGASASCCRP